MKTFMTILVTAVVVAALVLFIPKVVHTCDDCEEWFFGPGYEALLDKEDTICKECAEKQHVIGIGLGADVEEYQKSLF